MNGPVISLTIAGCAAYLLFMSAVGRWLSQSRERESIVTPTSLTVGDHSGADRVTNPMPGERERIAL